MIKVEELDFPGVFEIQPRVYSDDRGLSVELFNSKNYEFTRSSQYPLEYFSSSKYGVIRGIHYQRNWPQGKLVTCLSGTIKDVIVDLNRSSEHYGKHISVILSSEKLNQIWIPAGYGHGYSVISKNGALVNYKLSSKFLENDQFGVIWNDKSLNIDWSVDNPIVSKRDSLFPPLST